MKKIVLMLLIILNVLLFAACDRQTNINDEPVIYEGVKEDSITNEETFDIRQSDLVTLDTFVEEEISQYSHLNLYLHNGVLIDENFCIETVCTEIEQSYISEVNELVLLFQHAKEFRISEMGTSGVVDLDDNHHLRRISESKYLYYYNDFKIEIDVENQSIELNDQTISIKKHIANLNEAYSEDNLLFEIFEEVLYIHREIENVLLYRFESYEVVINSSEMLKQEMLVDYNTKSVALEVSIFKLTDVKKIEYISGEPFTDDNMSTLSDLVDYLIQSPRPFRVINRPSTNEYERFFEILETVNNRYYPEMIPLTNDGVIQVLLVGEDSVISPKGEAYFDEGIVLLNYDIASANVVVDNPVDINTEGTYTITYSVTVNGFVYTETREVEIKNALRIELETIMTSFAMEVAEKIAPQIGGSSSSQMNVSNEDDIVLPEDIGYSYPHTSLTLFPKDILPRYGIWSRVEDNANILIGKNGWVANIKNMIVNGTSSDNITKEGDLYHIVKPNFEAFVEYDGVSIDLSFFYANESQSCDGEYDRIYAKYSDEFGFMIISDECYYNGEEQVHQLIASYMNSDLDEVSGSTYTLFNYESNPVGEDLLLTISDDTYSVTGIMDRYLDSTITEGDVDPFKLGHILLSEGSGNTIGQIINPGYYDRNIYRWNVILCLNAFEGWSKVEFDGSSPGVIYDVEENEVPRYKVLLLDQIPYITQDLSSIDSVAFTGDVIDSIFAYPNNIRLIDYEDIKALFLLSTSEVDPATIGLNAMSREGLYDFMITMQTDFTNMTEYFVTLEEIE